MGERRVKREIARAYDLLKDTKEWVVIAHERADGDAIGSMLGVALGLRAKGHTVHTVLRDGIPASFKFLPGASEVRSSLPDNQTSLIVVDCSNLKRTGFEEQLKNRQPALNIDHHPTNSEFAEINLVVTQAASTAEILFDLFPDFNLQIDPSVATCLLTGLLTDTIGFRTASTSPKTLRIAAELIEHGGQLADLYQRTLIRRNLASVRYWGNGLLRLEHQDRLVWTSLTLADRESANYPGADDANLINLLSTIEDIDVSLIFVEQEGGNIKVSWRSKSGLDVSQVAEMFGGGGHVQAAGALIEGQLEEIKSRVVAATATALYPLPEPSE